MIATAEPTLTADEFMDRHGGELGVDLVRGQVVRHPMPGGKHGRVCTNVSFAAEAFLRATPLGRTFSNDTFVRIGPDTLRGGDICYWSFATLPLDQPIPDGVIEAPPDLVFEVRSPSDLWTDVIAKMLEYIRIGVPVVVILDPKTESASVFRPGDRQDIYEKDQTLALPDVLPGFAAPVADFFRA